MEYEVVIGLEVHAELSTESKIYCSCKNAFGGMVNAQVCPICLGMPGTLPTLNKQVVDYAILMGHATNCKINNITKQDRKNYMYPDLPKAYQISQYDIPICEHGYVDFMLNGEKKRVGITRIHIEEDAGKLIHDEKFSGSLVDFNRCGVPLIEIVSEPDIRSSEEAKAYLETIKSILQYLDISDCKMQEGSLRCDVNVSIMPKGSKEFGTRCEMKNVNTFSGAVRAIEYEIARQIELVESGGTVEQQTRRWDDAKGVSVLLRSKEDAQDYRYFPEPDLRAIYVTEEHVAELKAQIPELPNQKIERYMKDCQLPQIEATLLAENIQKSKFFEACLAIGGVSPRSISNWILGDISKTLNERNCEIDELALQPAALIEMIKLAEAKTISSTAAKTVLEEIIDCADADVAAIVKEKGLAQISDTSALEGVVEQVLADNAKAVEDYHNGKTNVLGFLVGQCMRLSKGKGNPAVLRELLEKKI
ncbi:Asp-tRNA(Asn)/Glu-tRNA(Gln) amidotransferase subunit GatB [Neobittarella massiliensis]|uniref:Aspartyl/glutamyl-tRNA(Asn/Gln) amidotransferase subunit B n=1 Tax=Neobittarella massiliensis (ex Bilen et al. 2018) TaxID=2041842 RepID=A0A8J6LYQ2_9FIRM|nr:Asp-tRNA(Asn)/Glu-tRNA(Gln) amidotransferase subunit GatB [Neobittarella massiliensis]MBC3515733.1 Asp-tRNA(Asn)/Glu-tRNA(Gln) amidotransferase subunit GatB [Neobittarella massiliensis]